MERRPFYQIKPSAYLFRSDDQKAKDRLDLEEPVRQWCAFELIRAYGIQVQRLTFEAEARVGSKTYRIDILIKLKDQPWAVVECKSNPIDLGFAFLRYQILLGTLLTSLHWTCADIDDS